MVADRDRFGLQLPAPRNRHDHLSEVIFAKTAATAIAEQRVRLWTVRLTAKRVRVAFLGSGFEDEVLRHINAQTLATILNADFLAVVLDLSVLCAKALRAVLALPDHRIPATAQPAAMLAAGRFPILADFHAFGSRYITGTRGTGGRRASVRLARCQGDDAQATSQGDRWVVGGGGYRRSLPCDGWRRR